MLEATWTKLKDGSWGLRVPAKVQPGDTVKAKTKAGKVEERVVAGIVWTDNKVWLCRVKDDRPAAGGMCDECGRPAARLYACRDSSGLVGRCCNNCSARSQYERSFA